MKTLITVILCGLYLSLNAQEPNFIDKIDIHYDIPHREQWILEDANRERMRALRNNDVLKFLHIFEFKYDRDLDMLGEDFLNGNFINYLRPWYTNFNFREELVFAYTLVYDENNIVRARWSEIITMHAESSNFKKFSRIEEQFLVDLYVAGEFDNAFWIVSTPKNYIFLVKGEEIKIFDKSKTKVYSMEEFLNDHWDDFSDHFNNTYRKYVKSQSLERERAAD